MVTIREEDLFLPVSEYLTRAGYSVRSEVKHCDVTAVKDDELIVIELKRSFTLPLLTQAVKRQRVADSVYVAVPMLKSGKFSRAWRDMCHLLRRLELGLIVVHFADTPWAEVCLHPAPLERRRNTKLRRNILKEIDGRSDDYNTGGTTGRKLVTAYRENAIHVASALSLYGPQSPAELRSRGTSAKTLAILSANHYGWFVRIDRGLYGLSDKGRKDLDAYPDLKTRYTSDVLARAEASAHSDAPDADPLAGGSLPPSEP